MSWLERILEDPERFARVKRAGLVLLVVVVLAEILVVNVLHLGHPHFSVERLPGFSSLYGFAACVLIVVVSKLIGHLGLMRREDYYD
jgi:hypothetical protein